MYMYVNPDVTGPMAPPSWRVGSWTVGSWISMWKALAARIALPDELIYYNPCHTERFRETADKVAVNGKSLEKLFVRCNI